MNMTDVDNQMAARCSIPDLTGVRTADVLLTRLYTSFTHQARYWHQMGVDDVAAGEVAFDQGDVLAANQALRMAHRSFSRAAAMQWAADLVDDVVTAAIELEKAEARAMLAELEEAGL